MCVCVCESRNWNVPGNKQKSGLIPLHASDHTETHKETVSLFCNIDYNRVRTLHLAIFYTARKPILILRKKND